MKINRKPNSNVARTTESEKFYNFFFSLYFHFIGECGIEILLNFIVFGIFSIFAQYFGIFSLHTRARVYVRHENDENSAEIESNQNMDIIVMLTF